jgi:hypothetical protein
MRIGVGVGAWRQGFAAEAAAEQLPEEALRGSLMRRSERERGEKRGAATADQTALSDQQRPSPYARNRAFAAPPSTLRCRKGCRAGWAAATTGMGLATEKSKPGL